MKLGGSRAFRRAMAWSPLTLALGFLFGALVHSGQIPDVLSGLVGPLGNLWTSALQLAVIPLVSTLLLAGIGSMPAANGLGRWSLAAIAVFLGFLALGAVVVLGISAFYLPQFGPSSVAAPSLTGGVPDAKALSMGEWVQSLLPTNLMQAAANGDMLPITLSVILIALAVRQIPDPGRTRLVESFQALRDALLVYLGWVLLLMPFASFALAYAFAAQTGLDAAGAALHFLLYTSGFLVLMTLLAYPLAALLGRVPLGRFARAVLPVQTVAAGSRSSLACLPSLVQGTKELELPDPAAEIVLPLAASTFKPNRTVSSTAKLLFCAALFGVNLSPGTVLSFVLTVVVLSISSPGIPSLGTRITFGAYVAAGIPPAGVLLFDALDPIVDVFKTIQNATTNLAAAAITSRWVGIRAVEPGSEPLLEAV